MSIASSPFAATPASSMPAGGIDVSGGHPSDVGLECSESGSSSSDETESSRVAVEGITQGSSFAMTAARFSAWRAARSLSSLSFQLNTTLPLTLRIASSVRNRQTRLMKWTRFFVFDRSMSSNASLGTTFADSGDASISTTPTTQERLIVSSAGRTEDFETTAASSSLRASPAPPTCNQ
eukprot:2851407-Prymnesium_polylepis.2